MSPASACGESQESSDRSAGRRRGRGASAATARSLPAFGVFRSDEQVLRKRVPPPPCLVSCTPKSPVQEPRGEVSMKIEALTAKEAFRDSTEMALAT